MKIKRSLLKYRGDHCLNCNQALEITDRYCPHCGQMNSTKKLKFDDFFNEFFSGLFAYDSRFNRTLRVLLFKPGKISKDYIQGKRTRYANPFRFYLSASILFFLLFGYSLEFDNDNLGPRDRDSLNFDFNSPSAPAPPKMGLDSINKVITSPAVGLDSLKIDTVRTTYKDYLVTQQEVDTMGTLDAFNSKISLYYHFQDETGIYSSERALDSLKHNQTTYNNWLYKKAVDAGTFWKNPRLFFDYFINKLPFFIFFYLPVFALFIWLLYIRRPFSYMEHLIFAFHVQTVFFVLYGLAILIQLITGGGVPVTLANFVFLFYLYKGMRNFYGQGRVKTILKFIVLNLIFFTLAIIAVVISLLASFSLY